VGALQNDEIDPARTSRTGRNVTNLAPVLSLITETDSQLQGFLPQ
jgi:hypothetical protein